MTPSSTLDAAEAHPAGHPPEGKALRTLLNEHAALRAMLQSLRMMLERGPGDAPERFFDVVRAMLFYIDEFPERQHHPKESDLLFPRIVRLAPELLPVIERLERDHVRGEALLRNLQHALLAWEMLGDSRRGAFAEAAVAYAEFYFEHMRLEEAEVLPAARRLFSAADWAALDAAFAANKDPFANGGAGDGVYDRLFTKIVTRAPAPIGVGSDEAGDAVPRA